LGTSVDKKNFLPSKNAIVRRSTISIARFINMTFRRVYIESFFKESFKLKELARDIQIQHKRFNSSQIFVRTVFISTDRRMDTGITI